MNGFDYAEMIEIPVTTSEVSVKKARKFRRKKTEALKRELIDAVNGGEIAEETSEKFEETGETAPDGAFTGTVEIVTGKEERRRLRKKRLIKADIVSAQVAVIIVLALTVMLTNIFWQDSGINTLVRGMFGSVSNTERDVAYTEFAPVVTNGTTVTLDDGVITFSEGGSIYSPCDGTVTNIAEYADKLDITVKYSPSFTAVISGAEYAYYGLGDSVYRSVPVCYSGGAVKMYLYSNGKLIKDYTLDNGKIVWET